MLFLSSTKGLGLLPLLPILLLLLIVSLDGVSSSPIEDKREQNQQTPFGSVKVTIAPLGDQRTRTQNVDGHFELSIHPDPHRVFHRPNGVSINLYKDLNTVNPPVGLELVPDGGKDQENFCSISAVEKSASAAGSKNVQLKCKEIDLSRFGRDSRFGEGEKKRFCIRESRP
ncbi:hypothetical protein GYMLUDRAFT_713998 [Collybiopsis luxurians FD-317 M1]|nr:hypothetical protein GYMLUDRAFT_713998 [Collybiopsis luxurians FD-317 M1]